MEPGDYQDAPLSKILHCIWSVGLLEGWNRGACAIDLERSWCKGRSKAYPLCIHSTQKTKLFITIACRTIDLWNWKEDFLSSAGNSLKVQIGVPFYTSHHITLYYISIYINVQYITLESILHYNILHFRFILKENSYFSQFTLRSI
jgi:hypothetical protein